MADRPKLRYADIVYEVLRSSGRPLTFAEIFEQVNLKEPVMTRNPRGTIRSALSSGKQIVNIGSGGSGRYGYLPQLLQGSLVRLPLNERTLAGQPVIYPDDLFSALWPSFFESQKRQSREPVRVRLPSGEDTSLSLDLLAPGTWGDPLAEPILGYLVESQAVAGDSLLIRVLEGEAGGCAVQFESRLTRDRAAEAGRNRELADAAERFLRERSSVEVFIWDLVIGLLARGLYRAEIAPAPLASILTSDARFTPAGSRAWVLTERLTPDLEDRLLRRHQLESELFGLARATPDGIEQVSEAT